MEDLFRTNYRSILVDDFDDDFNMFKSVKRTINSYIKNPNTEKLHSIYNRIVILQRLFHKDFLFGQLVENNDNEIGKNLMKYYNVEAFGVNMKFEEEMIEDLWGIQMVDLLENTKIRAEV